MTQSTDTSSIDNSWSSETFERVDGILFVVQKNKETVGSFMFTEKEDVKTWEKLITQLNENQLLQS